MKTRSASRTHKARTVKSVSPKRQNRKILNQFFEMLRGVTFNTGQIGYIHAIQHASNKTIGVFFDSCFPPEKLEETHVKQKVNLCMPDAIRAQLDTKGIEIRFEPVDKQAKSISATFNEDGETYAILPKHEEYCIVPPEDF